MKQKILLQLYFSIFFINISMLFAEIDVTNRGAWYVNYPDTSKTDDPTRLGYFDYFHSLPDKITLPLFLNKNLSSLAGKKLYVGYGLADPKGHNCRTFPGNMTDSGQDETICLPWWRIEREYKIKGGLGSDALTAFLDNLPMQYPPRAVSVCKQYETLEMAQGGKVTCTSYYDKLKSKECYNTPNQPQCLKDNCSDNLKTTCTLKGVQEGEVTSLITAFSPNDSAPKPEDGKTKLLTYQYECPDGYLPKQKCLAQVNALMYPFECKAPSFKGAKDGEYVYCPKENPIYDAGGNLKGFSGQCSDGRNVTCEVNTFNQKTRTCLEPLKEVYSTYTTLKKELYRNTYTEHSVDLSNGQIDPYAANPSCLRMHNEEPVLSYNPEEDGSMLSYVVNQIIINEAGDLGQRTSSGIHFLQAGDWDHGPGTSGCGVNPETGKAVYVAYKAWDGVTYANASVPTTQYDYNGPNFGCNIMFGGSRGCLINESTHFVHSIEFSTPASGANCTVKGIHRQCLSNYTFNPITYMCDSNQVTHKYHCYDDFPPDNLPPGCTKTNEQLTEPVIDITGKTLFTKKTIFAICSQVGERVIGCKRYDESTTKGGYNLNLDVAYESKDYNKLFGQAIATAQSQEQMLHVFSGWNGECEHGMFTDFSWLNDPMF